MKVAEFGATEMNSRKMILLILILLFKTAISLY